MCVVLLLMSVYCGQHTQARSCSEKKPCLLHNSSFTQTTAAELLMLMCVSYIDRPHPHLSFTRRQGVTVLYNALLPLLWTLHLSHSVLWTCWGNAYMMSPVIWIVHKCIQMSSSDDAALSDKAWAGTVHNTVLYFGGEVWVGPHDSCIVPE